MKKILTSTNTPTEDIDALKRVFYTDTNTATETTATFSVTKVDVKSPGNLLDLVIESEYGEDTFELYLCNINSAWMTVDDNKLDIPFVKLEVGDSGIEITTVDRRDDEQIKRVIRRTRSIGGKVVPYQLELNEMDDVVEYDFPVYKVTRIS